MSAAASSILAAAKINLALVVGPKRPDSLHELVTIMQRVDLSDRITLEEGASLEVCGFVDDTIVRTALLRLAEATGAEPRWRIQLEKGIPLAAGLGGGSADAAAALTLANRTIGEPLGRMDLIRVAASVGSDVPFFLDPGPKLVEGAGERLTALDLPRDYWIVLALEAGAAKRSTAEVYSSFDEHEGYEGFDERARAVREIAVSCARPGDLARLPPNDLAAVAEASELPPRLLASGAFRADVSGAGPTVYGLFHDHGTAVAAASTLPDGTRTWVLAPVW